MRDRIERLVVLPFSLGCASHSSVELGAPTRSKADSDSRGTIVLRRKAGEDRSSIIAKMKKTNRPSSSSSSSSSSRFLVLPKPNVAATIHRLIKGIKSLSQLFFYKKDAEEKEPEMEIGYPTDVKHVTHIGLDGSTTTNNIKGWDNIKAPELLSFSPISFKQFELAMTSQAQQQPLINDPSSRFG